MTSDTPSAMFDLDKEINDFLYAHCDNPKDANPALYKLIESYRTQLLTAEMPDVMTWDEWINSPLANDAPIGIVARAEQYSRYVKSCYETYVQRLEISNHELSEQGIGLAYKNDHLQSENERLSADKTKLINIAQFAMIHLPKPVELDKLPDSTKAMNKMYNDAYSEAKEGLKALITHQID